MKNVLLPNFFALHQLMLLNSFFTHSILFSLYSSYALLAGCSELFSSLPSSSLLPLLPICLQWKERTACGRLACCSPVSGRLLCTCFTYACEHVTGRDAFVPCHWSLRESVITFPPDDGCNRALLQPASLTCQKWTVSHSERAILRLYLTRAAVKWSTVPLRWRWSERERGRDKKR